MLIIFPEDSEGSIKETFWSVYIELTVVLVWSMFKLCRGSASREEWLVIFSESLLCKLAADLLQAIHSNNYCNTDEY